jgi:adenosyl cobinamide kinase/adenosyl cobinamide phosphate guanylyltransferase
MPAAATNYVVVTKSDIEYKPPQFVCDNELQKRVTPPLPNNHHFMCITGPARSGKTSFAISMLTSPQCYRKVFHEVHVVMPSHSRKSLKDDIFKDHTRCYEELDYHTLSVIKQATSDASEKGRISLILMDDVGASLKDPDIQRELKDLIWNRRHHKTSIWTLAQSYNSLPMQIRKSISHLCMFKPVNRKEADLVFSELAYKEKDDLSDLLRFVFDKPHTWLLLDVADGTYYRNFDLIGTRADE